MWYNFEKKNANNLIMTNIIRFKVNTNFLMVKKYWSIIKDLIKKFPLVVFKQPKKNYI